MSQKIIHDHMERIVAFDFPPKRIISLCPSITETLFALNLSDRIVGRTRYCIHPEELVKDVKTVGGTKRIKEDVIDELCPDLIIAEKEENPKEAIERLAEKYPVYVTDVRTYEDGLKMIRDLGAITDKMESASDMVKEIEEKFKDLRHAGGLKVAYVIWQNPYMVAGVDTYIHSILEKCGFTNAFAHRPERYPEVSIEDFRTAAPDLILLSSEPFPFRKAHKKAFEQQFPNPKTMLIDGEICWYGVRMIKAADELNRLMVNLSFKK